MAKKKKAAEPTNAVAGAAEPKKIYCKVPITAPRVFGPNVTPRRASLNIVNGSRWHKDEKLTYYFFGDDAPQWAANEDQRQLVRQAFANWKALGLALDFEEVANTRQSQIRIGFEADDGHWSFIGTEIIKTPKNEKTMNLDPMDRQLLDPAGIDIALHEIGHTLGFPHEHQNPTNGIKWDRGAVIAHFGGPPNNWPQEQTEYNILNPFDKNLVDGSPWDKDSIMHYRFKEGLILDPPEYQLQPLIPHGGLSPRDIDLVRGWYGDAPPEEELSLFASVKLGIPIGKQKNYLFIPDATRTYAVQTFSPGGQADTILDISQQTDSGWEKIVEDNDSGLDKNAQIQQILVSGQRYRIRVQLLFADHPDDVAIMLW